MPDRMSNRMSEDMSDRMPEDLPVRKCINVMVGITRSKVIFSYIPIVILKYPRRFLGEIIFAVVKIPCFSVYAM